MESIIKINSSNAFAETAIPGSFLSSKLLDFLIPGDMGVIDLGSSFITINSELLSITNPASPISSEVVGDDNGLYNNALIMNTSAVANKQSSVVASASLVRNVQMSSQNKGMVESTRRVDTLRQILFNLENNSQQIKNGLNNIGTFQGRRGIHNQTSSHLFAVTNNTDSVGVADLLNKSYSIPEDLRIPLSDILGVGSAMWDSNLYGPTRINLELNINKLAIQRLGGQEAVTNIPGSTGHKYGQCQDIAYTVGSSAAYFAELTADYLDLGLNMPFHVNQAINVTAVNPAGVKGVILANAAGLKLVGGSGYTSGDTGTATYTGGATPAQFTWTINSVGTGGDILTYTLDGALNKAYGFEIGDVISFAGATTGTGASLTVTVITGGGILTTTQTGTPSTAPTVGEVVTYTTLTGSGYGFAGTIATVTPITIDITNRGVGYAVGDTLTGTTPTAASGVNCTIASITDVSETIDKNTIIDAISYGTANGGTDDESVVLVLRDALTSPVGVTTITDVLVKALLSDAATGQIRLNKAEITLSLMKGAKGAPSIDYRTYVTEEQNGNSQPSFFHQYNIEPETQNIIVALVPNNDIAPFQQFSDYSISVDNEDQTGNRSVTHGSNLYQDRALRFFRNRGEVPQNLSFNCLSTVLQEGAANDGRLNQLPFYTILETIPSSNNNQMVNLNINATSNQQVILYKEISRTI